MAEEIPVGKRTSGEKSAGKRAAGKRPAGKRPVTKKMPLKLSGRQFSKQKQKLCYTKLEILND